MPPPEPPQFQDFTVATQDHAPPTGSLTPNTLTEAEAAFTFNSMLQTSSAGKPQPTTPLAVDSHPSQSTGNYLTAASAASTTSQPPLPEPPYPSEHAAEEVRALLPGMLSRGTTQAVLQKMNSHAESGGGDLALGRRASREGERRTSAIKVGEGLDFHVGKPGFDRKQSWNKEDMKRVMSERLMADEESAGYSSKKD